MKCRFTARRCHPKVGASLIACALVAYAQAAYAHNSSFKMNFTKQTKFYKVAKFRKRIEKSCSLATAFFELLGEILSFNIET